MATTPHQPNDNTHFQLERLILFSDAVFAIAITLLIIEIKVPHIEEHASEKAIQEALWHQIPEWIGFFISFWVIGIYWRVHHTMFGYVVQYNNGLILLNLLFLMTIVIMPFSSALYSNFSGLQTPFVFYCINVSSTGLCLIWLWYYINKPDNKLSVGISPVVRQHGYVRNLVAPAIFLLAALIAIALPTSIALSRFTFILIFPIQLILKRVYEPKLEAAWARKKL